MPAYTFPANREDLSVLRIVVRNGFTHDLADLLLGDLRRSCTSYGPRPPLSVTAARRRSPTAPDHVRLKRRLLSVRPRSRGALSADSLGAQGR
jgi:hypothetical protein